MVKRVLRISAFTLIVFVLSCTNAYKMRPALAAKIDKLSKEVILKNNDSAALAFLKDSCTKDELIKLLDHKVPLIRILAYRAIVNRNEPDFLNILKSHLNDTAKVEWWYYDDAASKFYVSDLMIIKAEDKASKKQMDTLADMVRNHLYLNSAKGVILSMAPDEKYYRLIRHWADTASDSCTSAALEEALAKYKKQDDILFMKSKLRNFTTYNFCNKHIFRAIEIFPDSAFMPVLENYLQTKIRKVKQYRYDDLEKYCTAVAVYKNSRALTILEALTMKSTYPDDSYLTANNMFVYNAIRKYYTPIYKDLYNKLKVECSKPF